VARAMTFSLQPLQGADLRKRLEPTGLPMEILADNCAAIEQEIPAGIEELEGMLREPIPSPLSGQARTPATNRLRRITSVNLQAVRIFLGRGGSWPPVVTLSTISGRPRCFQAVLCCGFPHTRNTGDRCCSVVIRQTDRVAWAAKKASVPERSPQAGLAGIAAISGRCPKASHASLAASRIGPLDHRIA